MERFFASVSNNKMVVGARKKSLFPSRPYKREDSGMGKKSLSN